MANPIALPLRYLALGDSYTIGEAVPAADCWPAQLVLHLRRDGVRIGEPQIIAVTGWTCAELDDGMDAAMLARSYALVTLQIGVNNQYRGLSVADYRPQFAALLARAIALAGTIAARVVVVSIPDWSVTPFARRQQRNLARVAQDVDAYNAAACALTLGCGAHWCDVTAISRQHSDLLAADGLHPSAAQYQLWTARILPTARAALAVGSG